MDLARIMQLGVPLSARHGALHVLLGAQGHPPAPSRQENPRCSLLAPFRDVGATEAGAASSTQSHALQRATGGARRQVRWQNAATGVRDCICVIAVCCAFIPPIVPMLSQEASLLSLEKEQLVNVLLGLVKRSEVSPDEAGC